MMLWLVALLLVDSTGKMRASHAILLHYYGSDSHRTKRFKKKKRKTLAVLFP